MSRPRPCGVEERLSTAPVLASYVMRCHAQPGLKGWKRSLIILRLCERAIAVKVALPVSRPAHHSSSKFMRLSAITLNQLRGSLGAVFHERRQPTRGEKRVLSEAAVVWRNARAVSLPVSVHSCPKEVNMTKPTSCVCVSKRSLASPSANEAPLRSHHADAAGGAPAARERLYSLSSTPGQKPDTQLLLETVSHPYLPLSPLLG